MTGKDIKNRSLAGDGWAARAYETSAYAGNWNVNVRAKCATVAP